MDWLTIACGIVLIAAGGMRMLVENMGRVPAATGLRRFVPYLLISFGVLFIAFELVVSAGG